ncbi:hypothetical protein [uncultured Desulfovibrio sp.]|uniref:hypothetical protein n=1 Tax=uncultured Desulfovibrio sp. TaxID=167968 RepID=UPI00266F6CE6|nr:hypothetical protein [uncultured Desulfovibrio sp.]
MFEQGTAHGVFLNTAGAHSCFSLSLFWGGVMGIFMGFSRAIGPLGQKKAYALFLNSTLTDALSMKFLMRCTKARLLSRSAFAEKLSLPLSSEKSSTNSPFYKFQPPF